MNKDTEKGMSVNVDIINLWVKTSNRVLKKTN